MSGDEFVAEVAGASSFPASVPPLPELVARDAEMANPKSPPPKGISTRPGSMREFKAWALEAHGLARCGHVRQWPNARSIGCRH